MITIGRNTHLSHDYVSVIHQDRSSALWLGTRHGLNRFDKRTGQFRRFHHDPDVPESLSNDIILAIREDERSDGVLWVGTEGGGLNRLDSRSGKSKRIAIGGVRSSSVVDSILQDEAGQLWLSTSTGVGRFDPGRGSFRAYGGSDGLKNHSFIRNSGLETRDGEMYFGGGAGLTSFVPRLVRDNPHVPPVVLTSIRIFGEEALTPDSLAGITELKLSHRDNFVSIEFAALDFSAPGENEYAYQLEGVDPDWVHVGNRNFANYTNLDPGVYTFRVKAANNDGVWNDRGSVVRVIVAPAFWQTWWFRVATTLLLGAAAMLVHRARLSAVNSRNLELQGINAALNREVEERKRAESHSERLIAELGARNTEMERFIYTVSHDLKSPVVTIKGFLGLAQKELAKGNAARASQDLGRVDAAADRMHRLLNELLELSRISRVAKPAAAVDLNELAPEAIAHVAGLIAERGARVDVLPGLPIVLGDRARLVEVLQNLVENAVKFMGRQEAPRVVIGSRRDGDETVFYVQDNGKGIDPRFTERVFDLFERLDTETDGTGIGLALVKRIVELHEGRVWVESEGEGRGSTFCFTLPIAPGRPADRGIETG